MDCARRPFSELGVVLDDAADLHGMSSDPLATLTRLPTIAARHAQDSQLAVLSGRWPIGKPDPDVFVPGDVAPLRAIAAGSELSAAAATLEHLEQAGPQERAELVRLAASRVRHADAVLDAAPYFVPDEFIESVCGSDPPTAQQVAELRLPHERVAVFLGRDVPLDPSLFEAADFEAAEGAETLLSLRRGAYLTGVVLFADADGALSDIFLWLLTADPDPTQPHPFSEDRCRGVVAARLSRAGLAPLVQTLAAVTSWAPWSPVPRTFDTSERSLARRARSASFRRWEHRGAFVPALHVIDVLPSSRAKQPAGETAGTRRSPREHVRRGHFRRVAVGQGVRSLSPEERHYETRWIPPGVVNAGVGSPRSGVYRIRPSRRP